MITRHQKVWMKLAGICFFFGVVSVATVDDRATHTLTIRVVKTNRMGLDTQRDLYWQTDPANKKITVSSDGGHPRVKMSILADGCVGGAPQGLLELSSHDQDFVTDIAADTGRCQIDYSVDRQAVILQKGAFDRVVFTITDMD